MSNLREVYMFAYCIKFSLFSLSLIIISREHIGDIVYYHLSWVAQSSAPQPSYNVHYFCFMERVLVAHVVGYCILLSTISHRPILLLFRLSSADNCGASFCGEVFEDSPCVYSHHAGEAYMI